MQPSNDIERLDMRQMRLPKDPLQLELDRMQAEMEEMWSMVDTIESNYRRASLLMWGAIIFLVFLVLILLSRGV